MVGGLESAVWVKTEKYIKKPANSQKIIDKGSYFLYYSILHNQRRPRKDTSKIVAQTPTNCKCFFKTFAGINGFNTAE